MHMGSLSSIGKVKPKNLIHVLMNNEAHESVGGQATASSFIDIKKLVESNGYAEVMVADSKETLASHISYLLTKPGPNFLEVKVKPGSRADLGRPTESPQKNKSGFMTFLGVEF